MGKRLYKTLAKYVLGMLLILHIIGGKNSLRSQTPAANDSLITLEKNLYEAALLQVENHLLRQQNSSDSLIIDLLADARNLAEQEEWSGGREILNAILSLLETPPEDNNSHNLQSWEKNNDDEKYYNTSSLSLSMPNAAAQFQVESGIDYSQQEFEIDFVENDSVIVEELQNPYVSLAYYQPLNIGRQQFLTNHRLRMDNQFINYDFFVSMEVKARNRITRLELDENFFHDKTGDGSDFLDSRLSFFYGNPYSYENRWYLSVRGRYKWFTQSNALSEDILSADMTAYFEHFFKTTHSLYFYWAPGFYRESAASGYRYLQNRVGGFYRIWESYNRLLEVGGEIAYQNIDNTINEEPYHNSYLSFHPAAQMEWPYSKHLGIEARLMAENRNYSTADAVNPSYNYLTSLLVQKFYLGDLSSLGIGYFGEKQAHRVNREDEEQFARQGDFTSHGPVFTAEYLNLSGILFTAEYRITWRDYPHAEYSFLSSYYSNRFVHSLSLFGWIPLTRHWQLQAFANYDNDQDRDNERNDTRNTLLNAGVVYKF